MRQTYHTKYANTNKMQRHHSEDVDMSDEQEDERQDKGFNGKKKHTENDDSMNNNSEG